MLHRTIGYSLVNKMFENLLSQVERLLGRYLSGSEESPFFKRERTIENTHRKLGTMYTVFGNIA